MANNANNAIITNLSRAGGSGEGGKARNGGTTKGDIESEETLFD